MNFLWTVKKIALTELNWEVFFFVRKSLTTLTLNLLHFVNRQPAIQLKSSFRPQEPFWIAT